MFKKPIKKNNDQDEVLIEPPMKGKKISLNKIINSAPDGSLIKLTEGEYLINKTIVINKPVRLYGEGIDKTTITGNGLALLLESQGGNDIEIKDISFFTNSEEPTTAVEISGGEINITACSFTGGVYSPDKISGNGVFVRGNAQVSIVDSQFFENQESGLRIGGNVQAIVKKCKFMQNDSGLAVTENASIEVSNCDFTEDHVGFAFDDSATGVISENRIFKNRGGSLAKGSSTPKIINNEFIQNDLSIGLAEDCNVTIKDNLISSGGDWGIKLVHKSTALIEGNSIQECTSGIGSLEQSNTKIYRNNILRNTSVGIIIRDSAITHIAENMISDNQFGIEVNHDVSFLVENNHIIRNSKLGMYTRRQAKGTVQKNVIEKNGDGGLIILDDSTVDFDNYKEPVEPGKPLSYSGQHPQITVHTPKDTDRVFFGDLIANIQPDTEIVLEDGEYNLSDPLFIDKSIKLIAKTIGNVKITGYDLPNLLVYEGIGKLSLVGISLSLDS